MRRLVPCVVVGWPVVVVSEVVPSVVVVVVGVVLVTSFAKIIVKRYYLDIKELLSGRFNRSKNQ